MIGIRYSKARALELLESLASGQSLAPPSADGWTPEDLLQVAGACFFIHLQSSEMDVEYDAPPQDQEAFESRRYDEIHAAIEWHARMTGLVHQGDYDEQFETEHEAMLRVSDGDVEISPLAGFKREEEPREEWRG